MQSIFKVATAIRTCVVLVTIAFSYIVFHERLTKKTGIGLTMIVAGTLTMLI